jgi:leucyl/phenylalanyl-tRNA--protein transferase
VALVGLCSLLRADDDPRRLVDVQWQTPHLATLGVREVPRDEYLAVLPEVLSAPLPACWA